MKSDSHEGKTITYGPVPTRVSWHQFVLAEVGHYPSAPVGDPCNGLITPSPPCGAVIYTGIADGNVAVEVQVHQQEPPPGVPPLEEWEDIAEVTVQAPTGQLMVCALMDDGPSLPPVTASGAGAYRVRVHARGRDIAYDAALLDEIVEDYLIQVWPAPSASEVIHKQTDACGAGLRRSAARNAARMAGKSSSPTPD
ncbi:hypothetical protein [Actinomadura alba]|uniref:Uncharacterized protein n=1 Tax=Actinomadura alba TaxID=406431 RepID=A0ABR7LV26_9ACTN|nr:hypothetical protein [Actinomadura alba]MBC6468310.1 hypothetical protein [Actinomadura alba]